MQRLSLPISTASAAPIDLELAPGVYTAEDARADGALGPAAARSAAAADQRADALVLARRARASGARSRVEIVGGERTAPDAAGVQPDDAGALHQAERRPVPEDHARRAARARGLLEPGAQRRGRRGGAPLSRDVDAPVGACTRACA